MRSKTETVFNKKFNSVPCWPLFHLKQWMFPLTCFSLDLHSADPFTHGNKRVVIFLQALVGFLVQSGKGSELCPIKLLTLGVKDDAEGGHNTVEISLFTTGPSDREKNNRRELQLPKVT